MGISTQRIGGLAEIYHARWVNPAATCGMASHLIHNLSSARLVAALRPAKLSSLTKSLFPIHQGLWQKTEGWREDCCRNIPSLEGNESLLVLMNFVSASPVHVSVHMK